MYFTPDKNGETKERRSQPADLNLKNLKNVMVYERRQEKHVDIPLIYFLLMQTSTQT